MAPGALRGRRQDQAVRSALLAARLEVRETDGLHPLIALSIGTGPTNANPATILESWLSILACIIIRHVLRNWFVRFFAKASAHIRNSFSAILCWGLIIFPPGIRPKAVWGHFGHDLGNVFAAEICFSSFCIKTPQQFFVVAKTVC